MANWSNPTLTTTYQSFLDTLKDRDVDLAVAFSPSFSTATNIPTGTVRWNPTNAYWEVRSSTGTWGPLVAKYLIDVDKLDGQDGSYYLAWGNITGRPSTFTPSAHTHDDRYYTETESDARFGNNLAVSGNTIQIRTPGNTVLNSITVPYATAAGNASTVGGFSVGQNLLTTNNVTFNALTLAANLTVNGNAIQLGDSGDTLPTINFWDNTAATYRAIRWSASANDWQFEDSAGTMRRIYHESHPQTWAEIPDKPSTFTPSTHSHDFGTM